MKYVAIRMDTMEVISVQYADSMEDAEPLLISDIREDVKMSENPNFVNVFPIKYNQERQVLETSAYAQFGPTCEEIRVEIYEVDQSKPLNDSTYLSAETIQNLLSTPDDHFIRWVKMCITDHTTYTGPAYPMTLLKQRMKELGLDRKCEVGNINS